MGLLVSSSDAVALITSGCGERRALAAASPPPLGRRAGRRRQPVPRRCPAAPPSRRPRLSSTSRRLLTALPLPFRCLSSTFSPTFHCPLVAQE